MSEEQVSEAPVEQTPEPVTPPHEEKNGTNGTQQPTWKYADNIPGEGDRPDWFQGDKYGSVVEQAKATQELRKKLGSRAEDAPESYSLDYDKHGIDKNDAVLAEFNPFFKELNVPQKDYEKIVEKFVDIQKRNQEIMEKQRTESFNAFGPETKETVGRLNTWATNNFSAEEQAIVKGFMGSAEEIKVLEKMRAGAPKSAPPTANQVANSTQYETLESINREIGQSWAKMSENNSYRQMMLSKRAEAHKRETG